MTGEQYRSYPESLIMRQVSVDARDRNNRAEQFKVATTILDASIDGGQIGDLFERRWDGEVDIRSIKSTMKMDILRCKTPEMVEKEIWVYLLAYNLLRTVMAVAANENQVEPRAISFKGTKQIVTAFAPKLEAARPEQRAGLVDARGGDIPVRLDELVGRLHHCLHRRQPAVFSVAGASSIRWNSHVTHSRSCCSFHATCWFAAIGLDLGHSVYLLLSDEALDVLVLLSVLRIDLSASVRHTEASNTRLGASVDVTDARISATSH